jgi:hypothetical protein
MEIENLCEIVANSYYCTIDDILKEFMSHYNFTEDDMKKFGTVEYEAANMLNNTLLETWYYDDRIIFMISRNYLKYKFDLIWKLPANISNRSYRRV